ncbi:MAG: hypothetical protein HC902_12575, partial [Calothrix sp. SM1_5_4]|nr:hypothetical protein [Calothrix sp. SM1_5_4]
SGVALSTGGGGSGPGSEGSTSSEDNSDSSPAPYVNPFANLDARKKEMIAGKTVLFDGEPIGVRGNNIFDMIHQAYQRKRAGNHFIEGDEKPAPRAPASAAPPAAGAVKKKRPDGR